MPRLVSTWFHETERRSAHLDFNLFGDLLHDALGETDHDLCDLLAGGAGSGRLAGPQHRPPT